jgi:hypothetical protein
MKNSMGLHRSAEFLKANPKQAPQLDHMRIHPPDGEGMIKVTHHSGPDTRPHAVHQLDGKDALEDHLEQHMGPAYDSEGGGEHSAVDGEEAET